MPLTVESKRISRQTLAVWWGIRGREDLLAALTWIEQGGHRQQFSSVGEHVSKLSLEESKRLVSSLNAEDANSVVIARRYYQALGQKGITGWDYSRYINLCRWGYASGYLSEEEAWEFIMSAASILRSTFSSWQELGENYLIGREFWSLDQTQKDGQLMQAAYKRLLNNASSPWNRIPWALSLE